MSNMTSKLIILMDEPVRCSCQSQKVFIWNNRAYMVSETIQWSLVHGACGAEKASNQLTVTNNAVYSICLMLAVLGMTFSGADPGSIIYGVILDMIASVIFL